MNADQALKIQAYLDGELPSGEAQQVADWLAQDREAKALFAELEITSSVLAANQAEVKMPESREFFWSKIEREINRHEAKPQPAPEPVSIFRLLHRYVVPMGAAAVLALVGVITLKSPQSFETASTTSARPGEIESLNEEMGSISFRSESDRMTVIYLYDRTQETSGTSDNSSFQ